MPFTFSNLLFEPRYLLVLRKRFGFVPSIIIVSSIAFLAGTLVIIPVNLLMGGKILTGLVVNLIMCAVFMPYHLFQVIRLLSDLDTLKSELYDTSIRDELTHAFNRRHFLQVLHALKTEDYQIPANTSLLMMDIDDFKQINDRYGHRAGDEALKALAAHCSTVLRATDIFARYGGDEFICLLPHTNLSQAQEVARRVREQTAQIPLSHGETPLRITTSIGVTTAISEVNLDTFISHADQALYEAKRRGKDQIGVYN